MSGIQGRALEATTPGETRNTVDDQTVETPRTLLAVRAMCGILRHLVSGIPDADPHGTIRGHLACIATTGTTRDEEQEEQSCGPSAGSVGARQSVTEKELVNPVEEEAERLRSSTECDPEGRQRGDVPRTMRDLRESVAAHSLDHGGPRDEAEQSHSACVHTEATGRDRILQLPLLSTRTWEYDDKGHAVAEPSLGMLDVQYYLRTQPGRVRCSTCRQGESRLYWDCSTCSTTSGLSLDGCDVRCVDRRSLEGADGNMVSVGDDETLCL